MHDGEREDSEALEALGRALAGLSDARREVVVMRYYRGMSVAQTAQTLGIAEGTVKSRCHGALRELRDRIEKNKDPETSE
jgi:RNA polymerase sigma-70 factor (ECF subfamily)